MQNIKIKNGFTLAEILVAIAVMIILALGVANTNYSRLTQKQVVAIESVKVSNLIEEIRNNALVGRGIGTNLDTPNSWRILMREEISSTNRGRLLSYYILPVGPWVAYTLNWQSKDPVTLTNLQCKRFNGTVSNVSGTLTITFTRGDITLGGTGCNSPLDKILMFDIGNGNSIETLEFNTLTGVIEIK